MAVTARIIVTHIRIVLATAQPRRNYDCDHTEIKKIGIHVYIQIRSSAWSKPFKIIRQMAMEFGIFFKLKHYSEVKDGSDLLKTENELFY